MDVQGIKQRSNSCLSAAINECCLMQSAGACGATKQLMNPMLNVNDLLVAVPKEQCTFMGLQ